MAKTIEQQLEELTEAVSTLKSSDTFAEQIMASGDDKIWVKKVGGQVRILRDESAKTSRTIETLVTNFREFKDEDFKKLSDKVNSMELMLKEIHLHYFPSKRSSSKGSGE